jgi:hypothetical protein
MRPIRLTQVVLVGSAAVVGGLVGLATNAASAQQEPWPGPLRWVQDNPWWAMAVLVGVGIVVAIGVDVRSRGDRTEVIGELTLAQVADQLALAVGTQWQDEAQLRRLNDPHPLPVAWQPADFDLIEPWEALCISAASWPGGRPTDSASWATSPAELAGTDNDLADRLGKIPTGRLVVLGEPGAGKTMLLIRLVLELLVRRHPGGPVPVLIPLAGWNPVDQDLWTWLEARLTVDHPGLSEPGPPPDRCNHSGAGAMGPPTAPTDPGRPRRAPRGSLEPGRHPTQRRTYSTPGAGARQSHGGLPAGGHPRRCSHGPTGEVVGGGRDQPATPSARRRSELLAPGRG